LPVLLEQRAAHHRFRRQAVSSGLLDPVPAQIAGRQTQQRTVFVEPLRDGFQLAADLVLRKNLKNSCLDDAFLTHCRVPTVAGFASNSMVCPRTIFETAAFGTAENRNSKGFFSSLAFVDGH
jgi:hypothetical protein